MDLYGTTYLLPQKNYGALLLEDKKKLTCLIARRAIPESCGTHEGKKLEFPASNLGM